MPMSRDDLLNSTISDGIHHLIITYPSADDDHKKTGGIKGFERCRGKNNDELLAELNLAKGCIEKAKSENDQRWIEHWTIYAEQIEWVLRIITAGKLGQPSII